MTHSSVRMTMSIDPHWQTIVARGQDRICDPIAYSVGVFLFVPTWGGVGIFMKGHKLKVWWCSEKGASLKYEFIILTIVPMYGKRA